MRDLGILEQLDQSSDDGISACNIAKNLDISLYGVETLLESGLSCGVVEKHDNDELYVLSKVGYFLLHDEMTRINMDYNHYICYLGMYYLEEAIKTGKPERHNKLMISAVLVSAVFFACYLYYHANYPATPYGGEGGMRMLYFAVLVPHVILAMVMLPGIFALLFFALKERFELHRKIARWVWPVWVYVSITGVLVYLMLYILPQ